VPHDPAVAAGKDENVTLAAGGSRAVLILAPDDADRAGLAAKLRERRFETFEATRLDAALDPQTSTIPETAILDLRLVGESGYCLLRQVLDGGFASRVAVLTAHRWIGGALHSIRDANAGGLAPGMTATEVLAVIDDVAPSTAAATPSLAWVERRYVERVLAAAGGNLSEAARRLGIHRRSLQRQLLKWAPAR
jgi:two-component system response regulator RegA